MLVKLPLQYVKGPCFPISTKFLGALSSRWHLAYSLYSTLKLEMIYGGFHGYLTFYSTLKLYLLSFPSWSLNGASPSIPSPSTLLIREISLLMPCHFSGLFYVSQFKDNKLLCSFKDENGDLRQIDIIYYFPATVDRPFPQAYEAIQAGHVYFITGSMAFHDKDLIVFPFNIFNRADLS